MDATIFRHVLVMLVPFSRSNSFSSMPSSFLIVAILSSVTLSTTSSSSGFLPARISPHSIIQLIVPRSTGLAIKKQAVISLKRLHHSMKTHASTASCRDLFLSEVSDISVRDLRT